MEKFVEYLKEEVRRLYATFPRQPITKLTDVLKREHETIFASKSSMTHRTKRYEITVTIRVYIEEQPTTIAT